MHDLPCKFAVLELRYNGFILTLNGLMVHGGHFRDATVSMLPHPFFVYTWIVFFFLMNLKYGPHLFMVVYMICAKIGIYGLYYVSYLVPVCPKEPML